MAYIVRNVDILDLQPSKGVGISLPFDGSTGINTTYTTADTLKSNLINFILTGKRERLMKPGFGSGVRDLLFEPITEDIIDQVKNLIEGGVSTYFPQVLIREINVNLSSERRTITIYLNYSILNTNIEDELQINLNNGRV